MKQIKVQAVDPSAMHNDGERHEIHVGGSNMTTVVRLTDAELDELLYQLHHYVRGTTP